MLRSLGGRAFSMHLGLNYWDAATRPGPIRTLSGPAGLLLGGAWGWLSWQPTLVDGVAKVLPSTVQIRVEMSGLRLEHVEKIMSTNGTGFVIKSDGLILTNAHVVADTLEGGHLRLIYHDGTSVWGEVLALDLDSDLAIIRPRKDDQVDVSKYPPITISEATLNLGEPIAALGNPLGLRNTVTVGVVGGIDRSNEDARQPDSRIRYLQTDLHTNPGSSGGPLLTREGEVVGMITTRADVQGITFAIQLDSVRGMIDELSQQHRISRPWLGFKGISISPELILQITDEERRELIRTNIHSGVLITKVHEQSPSSAASLRPGDIITHVNGLPVRSLGDILAQAAPANPNLTITTMRMIHSYSSTGRKLELRKITSQLVAAEFDILLRQHVNEQRE